MEVHPMNHGFMEDACLMAAPDDSSSYNLDIEPDDITVSDTVTVIWGIA